MVALLAVPLLIRHRSLEISRYLVENPANRNRRVRLQVASASGGSTMTGKWRLKQAFLRTLVVAFLASALIGIYAFLFGDFGETEVKILLTTLSISYFSVTSLACAAAFEKKKAWVLAPIGLTVGILGFLFFIPSIWAGWRESEMLGKSMAILAIFSFSFAQTCLLSLVPLKQSIRWVFVATVVTILALALYLSGMIVFEDGDEWFIRIAGVLGILDGCGSLLIPVLYKLGGKPAAYGEGGPLDRIGLTCPRCGHGDTYSVGTIKCAECSLGIRVEIAEESKDRSAGG